ncbi:capsule biosynthesis protein [Roseobacteraceae bacterium S113]
MTTKPKAKKFRIKRSNGGAGGGGTDTPPPRPEDMVAQQPQHPQAGQASADYGAGAPIGRIKPTQRPATPGDEAAIAEAMRAPNESEISQRVAPQEGEVSSAAQVSGETEIDAIRKEGLTGRQLRMARRVAQKHGLAATSDFDAVRQLRMRGINPFQRVNMLELVVPGEKGQAPEGAAPAKLPQTVPAGKDVQVPSTETSSPMERRVREVAEMQRDIARRRRRKSLLLIARLAFFVMLPTLICGFYFYAVATPMYSTKSAFLIIKADGGGAVSPSLLGSSPLATAQDAVAVQDYLHSKDAMIRLDEDLGFTQHFSQAWIDPVQRLSPTASNEEAHKIYKKYVQIGFDPTEGVIRMEVTAADPETSQIFSERLIQYAEERVDSLSQRKRENQVKDSERTLASAEEARRNAQETLVRLQLENGLIDPQGEIASLRTQISTFETQLREKGLELQALLDNSRPNQAKVDGARGDITRLENTIADLRREMNEPDLTGRSLADLAAQIQLAQADLATRDLMLSEALAQLSTTRREAISQVRYLTTSVEPVAPQDPSYPRSFENTVLSFLIFAGIYLMVSLTASILREQVSA